MKIFLDDGCAEYRRLGTDPRRRQVLRTGACGLLGLGLADLLRLEAAHSAPARMNCILLWLRGGPSSIDMWDLKPEAPPEIRGEFRPIETSVSGIRFSEHLPRLAKLAHRSCLIRSITHPRDDHEGGSHVMATGWNTWPQQTYPMYGAVVQKVLGFASSLPPHIHLPEPPQPYSGGMHYLPRSDFPFTISCMNDPDLRVRDASISSLSPDRVGRRRGLLAKTSERRSSDAEVVRTSDTFMERAFDLLTASAARSALDLTREPDKVRDRYGRARLEANVVAQGDAGDVAPNEYNRSVVGQALLMARRLIDGGTRFVTVVGRGWDTHADNFGRLKNQLLPFVDQGVSALVEDLHDRGMLDDTLVIVTGDFNRTPRINKDAGRDHWGHVQTVFLAGGGVPAGTVIGASDEQCAYPAEQPYTPGDLAATIYRKLGIPLQTELHAWDNRPFRLLPENARPISELL